MSTDRKLLEAAAKAAGLAAEWHEGCSELCIPSEWVHTPARRSGDFRIWNPIADDGDALRLAVKRRFHVCIFSATDGDIKTPGFVEVWQEMDTDPLHVEYVDDADYEAATRRAIVRAAAAIGAAK